MPKLYIDGVEMKHAYVFGNPMNYGYIDGVLAFESWIEHTGNFYVMTSNTTPVGFVASTTMKNDVTSQLATAWHGFNDNVNNSCGTGNANLGAEAKLLFAKPIKIEELTWAIGASHNSSQVGTNNLTFGVYGIKEDNTETLLFQHTSNSSSDKTVRVTPVTSDEVYKGIRFTKTDTLGWGNIQIYKLQVTKWKEKGS